VNTGLTLESELIGVQVVSLYAMQYGTVQQRVNDWRGRAGTSYLFYSFDEAVDGVLARHDYEQIYYIRMIPALRFNSDHGDLLVADLYGDCKGKPFTGVKGRQILTLQTPLLTIASAARSCAEKHPEAQVVVKVIGDQEMEELPKRAPLRSWSSQSLGGGEMIEFAEHANFYDKKYVRAVVRNFLAAN